MGLCARAGMVVVCWSVAAASFAVPPSQPADGLSPSTRTAETGALRQPRIDADFPGGNISVESIEQDRVLLRQDQRDTDRWWFYWYFRVREAANRTVTFAFTDGNPIGARGPAASTDGGRTWAWLGAETGQDASFTYAFPAGADEVRFCFTMPYVDTHLQAFLEEHRANPHLRVVEMTRTRKGRPVQAMHLGRRDGDCEHRVLLTARHHACETMASFVLEGVMQSILTDPDQQWLRENVEFLVVPFVDKDGVEDGDQGKARIPHDHNRDYAGRSIYPEVKALRDMVPDWADGKLRMALDLHCPFIRGRRNETVYFVGPRNEQLWENIQRLASVLESLPPDGLPYHSKNNLPFGQEWNTPANYGEGVSMAGWAGGLPGIRIASTLEVAYANASGTAVTAESARTFGKTLAHAIARFLRE